MASQSLTIARSILLLKLDNLHDAHKFSDAIKTATRRTTDRLLIIVFCNAFNADRRLNHTQNWRVIQSLLTFVYVEATRIAQDEDRVLMDVDVLLRGFDKEVNVQQADEWQHIFRLEGYLSTYPLPECVSSLPVTTLDSHVEPVLSPNTSASSETNTEALQNSTFPVVALGGTFDHLHSGHKILLSMSAWIAHEKVIVGVTDDKLLQKKANRHVLEPLGLRTERVRRFLEFFKPGLVYDVVPIDDVYGPTAVDPNIQALVVSKETLSGASSIAKLREEKGLPALECFVIDVISMTESSLEYENMDMLRQAKLSSTFIREWLVKKRANQAG